MKISFAFLATLPLLLLFLFCSNRQQVSGKVRPEAIKNSGFAVLELFTSEGCSSCPAGENAVQELQEQYPDDVYVLAFHVDYWNRLGWTDEFSKAGFTARQNEYAAQFNLESIYTPQVVINGRHEFVGSDKTQLQSVTAAELKKPSLSEIELTAQLKDDKTISVHYKIAASGGELHIALVQNEASTDVKGGENGGRKLHHINIVRDYKTISTKSPEGTVQLHLPAGIGANQTKIIAYAQDRSGAITAAKRINTTGA